MALTSKRPSGQSHPNAASVDKMLHEKPQKRFNFLVDADLLLEARQKALREGKPLAEITRDLIKNWVET